jgi:hypothetical protein
MNCTGYWKKVTIFQLIKKRNLHKRHSSRIQYRPLADRTLYRGKVDPTDDSYI